jgi:hypothetical protein
VESNFNILSDRADTRKCARVVCQNWARR